MIIPSSSNVPNLQSNGTPERLIPTDDIAPIPTSPLPEPMSDHLFLNNIRPEQAREFLLNHINRKLEVSPSLPVRSIADYSEDVSSINETSNQIIASINKALNIDSPNSVAKTAEVTINLNSGFTEAREILKNLNILRREFLTEFHDIQKNVNGFLDKITSDASTKTIDHVE